MGRTRFTMSNSSADLVWMLTRGNSSFLVKRESGRVQFSAEKYNLTAQNSFKYQGIANDKAVDIAQYYTDKEKKNPKGITLSTKSAKGVNAPVRPLALSIFVWAMQCGEVTEGRGGKRSRLSGRL